MSRPFRPRSRPGFTLVEVMVVILIIGLLTAILLPAVNSAVRAAREAAVLAEINNMAAALTKFKNDYGDYPPSRIVLMENGDYSTQPGNSSAHFQYSATLATVTADTTNGWLGTAAADYPSTGTDIAYGPLLDRSLLYLRKFFPRAQFSTSGALFTSNTSPFHDFNGDGALSSKPILLQGHECLAFFLGGVPNQGGGMTGFSRNPQFPFLNDSTMSARTAPAYEFNGGRLLDEDGDGIPGYIDTMGAGPDARFYAYFSAYSSGGSGAYDPNDVNFDTSATTAIPAAPIGDIYGTSQTNPLVAFQVGFLGGQASSAIPNPYTTSLTLATPPVWTNAQSFQILSAGRDRAYGLGGQYLSGSNGERLPVDQTTTPNSPYGGSPGTGDTGAARQLERDNLTNFGGGRLE